jgi:hypothetical protein
MPAWGAASATSVYTTWADPLASTFRTLQGRPSDAPAGAAAAARGSTAPVLALGAPGEPSAAELAGPLGTGAALPAAAAAGGAFSKGWPAAAVAAAGAAG